MASGQAKTGHYVRRRQELLDFMNKVVADYPDSEPHVVLDNLNIHKPKTDGWLRRHPRVHFHYAPTYACWLNRVECWFGILSRQALQGAGFISARELRKTIDPFATVYNPAAFHFDWKKTMAHLATLKRYCSNLRNWVPGRHANSHYSARCL
ncbi:MAG TPA: transposase [Terriglobia bacterium]|nr:transposase [Terriglobia bacterium]